MAQTEITNRELDALVAEAFRAHEHDNGSAYNTCPPVPKYSSDIAVMMLLENRIAELGLANKYAMVLAKSMSSWYGNSDMSKVYWDLAHATAKQRCLAALKALEK